MVRKLLSSMARALTAPTDWRKVSAIMLYGAAQRSRAKQMNVGADAAGGDIFWFLHADAEVPLESLNEIARIMRNPAVCGGFFRIRLPSAPAVYRLTDGFAHYAGLVLRMRCGDHGIFCRRSAFVDAGGFPDVPLMEDVEFFRRLRRCGRVVYSNKRIGASPRRYETVGPVRLTFAFGSIATLYLFGVSLPRLPAFTGACVVVRTSRRFCPNSAHTEPISNQHALLRARDYAA